MKIKFFSSSPCESGLAISEVIDQYCINVDIQVQNPKPRSRCKFYYENINRSITKLSLQISTCANTLINSPPPLLSNTTMKTNTR
jgi:hypothetical protein